MKIAKKSLLLLLQLGIGEIHRSCHFKKSSILSLQSDGGAFVSELAVEAALLSYFFDGKQSRDVIGCHASYHRRPKLRTFTFRSREARRLLSELDPHGGVDPLGFFLCFSENWPLYLLRNSAW